MKTTNHSNPSRLRGGFLPAVFGLLVAAVAQAGTTTNTWSGADTADNWSTAGNWTPGAPGETSTVFFTPADPASDQYTANNLVDTSRTIDSLFYWTTNVWQTTRIPAATSLTVTGKVTIPLYSGFTADWVFFCGKNFQDLPTAVNAAVLGEGTLVVTNPAALMSIRSYGGYATLDLSSLHTFDASVKQLTVGCEGFTQAALQNRPAGILFLARTNIIRGYSTTATVAGSGLPLAIGENRANQGLRSFVHLGVSNVFLADAGILVAGARNLGTLQFNATNAVPGTAYFRSLNGTGRQSNWYIGDNNTSSTGTGANGVADFTGGTVDAQINTLYVGRGLAANNVGVGDGTLLIGNGLVDVNTVYLGYMRAAGGPATGVLTTSGGASVTNLIVNNNLTLAYYLGTRPASGTLNIDSTVIVKGNIVGGGDNSTVNLNSGRLWVGGKLGNNTGANDRPLNNLNLNSGILTLNLGSAGNPITPVCNVSNLLAGDVTLNLEGSGLTPGVVPLIKFYNSGSFAGITPGSLPPKVTGAFSNSADTLYLIITGVDTPKWKGNVNGDWDINTTTNWVTGVGGLPTTYQEASIPGDPVLFDDTATATSVNLTTTLSPTSVTVNNSTKNYTFTSSGNLSGTASLSKQGADTLVLANTGVNDFTGNVTIGGGRLQLSGGDHRLPTNAVVNLADATGAVLDLNGLNQQLAAVSGGGASGGNVTLGAGTLTLSGNGSELAGVISGAGGLLKIGPGNQILSGTNTYDGGTVISNGTLTVANATGSGIGDGSLNIAGGTLQIGNGTAAGSISQTVITNDGNLQLNRSDDFVFGKTIVGTGGLTKNQPNLVSVTASNSYTGNTSINDGALRISDAGALGFGRIVIGNTAGARLELTNSITVPQAIQLLAKGGALNAPPHVESLGGTNTLVGQIEGISATDWTFQSDGGLLIVAGPFTNASTISPTLNLRGLGAGEWRTGLPNSQGVTGLAKRDTGTWTLTSSSTNTYTGLTTLMAGGGTLVVEGAILNSSGVIVNNGATLAGSGFIASPVTNAAGGFIAPGSSIGTLTISNRLVLNGGTCVIEVGDGQCDQIRGLTTVTFGGVFKAVVAGTLYGVETFKVFDAQTYAGTLAGYDLPDITPLAWDTTALETQGILRVTGGINVATAGLVGGQMQLAGTGPANNAYRVFATTNVALPFSQWLQVGSGTFAAGDGAFLFTDPNTGSFARRFYRMVTP